MSTAVDRYHISQRVAVGPGDLVRFTSGGPQWHDQDGEPHRLTLRGEWRIARVIRRGKRVWLDVVEVDRELGPGARRLVFVHGRSFRRHGLFWRPYKVKRLRVGEAG